MKLIPLPLLKSPILFVLLTSLMSGCSTSPSPPANTEQGSWIEGTIQDLEDGQLVLRLANGQTKDFGADLNVVPEKEVINSKGRKCRIKSKRILEETPAYAVWVNLVTHFEWLEPSSSRFTPVYVH